MILFIGLLGGMKMFEDEVDGLGRKLSDALKSKPKGRKNAVTPQIKTEAPVQVIDVRHDDEITSGFDIIPINNIIQGDCRERLAKFEANTFDAIVTDPPYELAFMGKTWDASGIAYDPEVWGQCLRVLKPGGHLLSFGGTRTYHRMVVSIEDAGFEIRDCIEWVNGSGFPKSLSIDKALDKINGRVYYREFKQYLNDARLKKGYSHLKVNELMQSALTGGGFSSSVMGDKQFNELPTVEMYSRLKKILGLDDRFDELIERIEAEREVIGKKSAGLGSGKTYAFQDLNNIADNEIDITAPSTDAAKQWAGWGTALKPAHEPICMARKPLNEKTIAENVLRWNTGGININDCRVGFANQADEKESKTKNQHGNFGSGQRNNKIYGEDLQDRTNYNATGRFPANLIWSHSPNCQPGICTPDCPIWEFAKAGVTKSGAMKREVSAYEGESTTGFLRGRSGPSNQRGDSGSVSRFFKSCQFTEEDIPAFMYYAKASHSERNGSTHPTMKPLSLMRYLCRLVTPPNGLILDPFAGSGTTCLAAKQEGFRFVGIELQEEYCQIARRRIFQ